MFLAGWLGKYSRTLICYFNFYRAIRIKLALGGGSTQIGFMAAAGLYSLNHMIERLEEDHDNAQYIANGIKKIWKNEQRNWRHINFLFIL